MNTFDTRKNLFKFRPFSLLATIFSDAGKAVAKCAMPLLTSGLIATTPCGSPVCRPPNGQRDDGGKETTLFPQSADRQVANRTAGFKPQPKQKT